MCRVRLGRLPPQKDPHETKERTMSPRKRDAKQHAKARKRRRLKAQERLAQDRRQAQHSAKALQKALDDLGLPKDLVTEIEGAYGVNRSCWARSWCDVSSAVWVPHQLRTVPRARLGQNLPSHLLGRSPSAPGSSACDAWASRCSSRCGATLPAKVRPRGAAGNGRG